MTDLSLVETEDLVTALVQRFDSFICKGVQRGTKSHIDTFYHRYSGGYAGALGLCGLLTEIIKDDYKKEGKNE